jgi:hypothetical protein
VQVASTVKQEHTVFTKLEVVDGGDSWNYHWEASPGDDKETSATKEEGTAGQAANWEQVQPLIGQSMGTPLPDGYAYQERDGRKFPTRLEDDDTKFEKLGLDKQNNIKLGESEDEDKDKPDPNRLPILEPQDDGFKALDPAADPTNNVVGLLSWEKGDGFVTLAVYPGKITIGGKAPTDDERMRGYPILTMMMDAMAAKLKQDAAEIEATLPEIFHPKARQVVEDEIKTYEIKGARGVWRGDSTNLVEFNDAYRKGSSLEDSARGTWTGRQVGKLYKYTNVSDSVTDPGPDDPSIEERRRLGFASVNCVFT